MAEQGTETPRVDKVAAYHEQFAERMIEAMKEGKAPWMKPWKPGEQVMPQNFASGREYRGGNAMFLAMAGGQYSDPRWGGYRQIQEAGGQVRAGEKGTPIMYVDRYDRRVDRDKRGQPRVDENGRSKYVHVERERPLVKVHHVFNVKQCEGLNLRPLPRTPEPEWETHTRAEHVVRASGVDVKHVAGDRALYDRKADVVTLPERGQFASAGKYYQTALHELGHATGHASRLNRSTLMESKGPRSRLYAQEELRAEMASLMTCARLGLGHEPRHGAAYVKSWVKALEENPKEIRMAAVDAQKATDWVMSRERRKEVEVERPVKDTRVESPTKAVERRPERPQEPTRVKGAGREQTKESSPPGRKESRREAAAHSVEVAR